MALWRPSPRSTRMASCGEKRLDGCTQERDGAGERPSMGFSPLLVPEPLRLV